MSSLPELIENYLAGTAAVRRAVRGMSPEQVRARPVPGKWSTLEVVCHLADFEPILAERMKRIIAEEKPPLIGANPDRFAATLAYSERNLEEELGLIDITRRQMACILRTLQPAALSRLGIHNEAGPRTLEQVLGGAINHVVHHVKFISEKRQALGLPD